MVLKSGTKSFCPESAVDWAIYPLGTDERRIYEDYPSYNGGPGQSYARRPIIRVGRRFILVKQYHGLDI